MCAVSPAGSKKNDAEAIYIVHTGIYNIQYTVCIYIYIYIQYTLLTGENYTRSLAPLLRHKSIFIGNKYFHAVNLLWAALITKMEKTPAQNLGSDCSIGGFEMFLLGSGIGSHFSICFRSISDFDSVCTAQFVFHCIIIAQKNLSTRFSQNFVQIGEC